MRHVLIAIAALLVASCSSGGSTEATVPPATSAALGLEPVTTSSSVVLAVASTTIVIETTTAVGPTMTTASAAPTTLATTSTTGPGATSTPSTAATTLATKPTFPASVAGRTPYSVPFEPGVNIGYAHEHHDYPASDIFAGDCGTTVVAPVNGTLLEVRREDLWSEATDNPATRGGKSISLLGDDGVRYYLAHFEQVLDGIEPGARVAVGDHLGQMGSTGRAGACHLHFALSPPCPGKEWSVRRGVIWPWPYLDAWRQGQQLSPADEIGQWSSDHPDACAEAMADAYAADS